MSETRLRLEREGHLAIVTIDRTEKLNTMTPGFWAGLRAVFTELEADGTVRAVVITGAGARAFSAGGDIGSLDRLGNLMERRDYQRDAMRGFMAVERSPLPVIAAVNGLALGGGCELTLACDIVIAAEHASFGMPEAALGLVPGYGIIRAADKIGRGMTKLMVMSRRRVDAATALRIGLVQDVVPADQLMPTARALAADIAQSSPLALDVGKRILDRGLANADYDYAIEALALLQSAPDVREGTRAFLEKRKPVFGSRLR